MKISVSDPAIPQQVVSQAPPPCPKRVLGKEKKNRTNSLCKAKKLSKGRKNVDLSGKICKNRGKISSAFLYVNLQKAHVSHRL
jgi:hypothetical protein